MPIATKDSPRVIKITPMHVAAAEPLLFPTIITQFEDKWTPGWRNETVYGRMDPMGFYAGTQRTLTLGFRVIAADIAEARINMGLIQKLVQYQYPAFQPRGRVATLKSPPYFKVELMNVGAQGTDALQGYLMSGISVNPGFQDKNTVQYYDAACTKLLFSDVNISFQMVVLHSAKVGFYGAKDDTGADKFAAGTAYPYNVSPPASPGQTRAKAAAKAARAKAARRRKARRSKVAKQNKILAAARDAAQIQGSGFSDEGQSFSTHQGQSLIGEGEK
ncbi:MAG: hypothetical protein GY922_04820 [Proteobacteria bacterium]|nr:hypothetical protein [Pseudomonadota bacterium]